VPPDALTVASVPRLKTEDVGVVLFHLVAPVADAGSQPINTLISKTFLASLSQSAFDTLSVQP
jgi:hypothetical protein